MNSALMPFCGFLCTFDRLHPIGDPPSPRAAHAATAVGTMVVIQACLFLFYALKMMYSIYS